MATEYQFVIYHEGRVPSQRALKRFAEDFNGKILAYQHYDTRTRFQAFLGRWLPADFPQHTEGFGALITAEFNSQETLESFQAKLKRIGVSLIEEKIRQTA